MTCDDAGMMKRAWYVKLEDVAGVEWSCVVDAVGYSQAITYARDKMNRDGIPDAYKVGSWEPVEINRATIAQQMSA